VAHEDDSVRINVRARREAQRLVLEVENSVAAQPSRRPGMGIGLSATRERLRTMFGAEHDVELSTGADGSVIVRVSIPFIQSGPLPAA
jgi:LytS/YehU family sensor histidine kinase